MTSVNEHSGPTDGYACNQDQCDYIDFLNSLPDEERCWCGWGEHGHCTNCKSVKTFADRNELRCKSCGNSPINENDSHITHRIGCREKCDCGAEYWRTIICEGSDGKPLWSRTECKICGHVVEA